MSKFVCIRRGRWLCPADESAEAVMARIKADTPVMVEVKQPRNLRMHRLWWALMDKIADNLDGVSAETVCDVVKIRIGHVETVQTKSGIVQTPKSISFAAMDDASFRDFWDSAVKFICAEVIPGLNREALESEIREMLMGRAA